MSITKTENSDAPAIRSFAWWQYGFIWGLFMYVTSEIIYPLIDQESLQMKRLLFGIPAWAIIGLANGLLFKATGKMLENTFARRKRSNQNTK